MLMERHIVNKNSQSIGFVGLGLMGAPIANHLTKQGYNLTVWNRTQSKSEKFLMNNANVIVASSLKELAASSEVIILCLTDETAVEEVLFAEHGIFQTNQVLKIVIDHSTINPDSARQIAFKLNQYKVQFIDAPVTGSVPGAIEGSLIVFAGGDEKTVDLVRPIMSSYSKRVNYLGINGAGQAMKICNQMLLHNAILSIFETMNVATRQGFTLDAIMRSLDDSLIDSKVWRIFSETIKNNGQKKLAHIKDMLKDLKYVSQTAHDVNASIPLTTKTIDLIEALMHVLKNPSADVIELQKIYTDPALI